MSKRFRSLFLAIFLLGTSSAHAQDPTELVFIFQKQKDPEVIRESADSVAKYLSTELGMPVRAQVPGDYSASVQALVSKKADFAYTSALPFLLAQRDGGAKLLLVEERADSQGVQRTEYDSVIVVSKDSALKDFSDLLKNASNLRIVFTSPTSTSGYVFPYRRFVQEGLLKPREDVKNAFRSVSFGGGYTQALEQVVQGRADVCAVSYYTVEGDTAAQYLPAEQQKKLRILARIPGVPTHLVSSRGGLSEELRGRVKAALLKLSTEKPELLTDVYGTARLVEVDSENHLKGAREAVEFLGIPMEGFLQ